MKQQNPLESVPKKRFFPSRKDYESIPRLKERREFLLAIIKKLEDHMNERNGNDTAVQESKIAELNELKEELESEGITVEYLDQFMQPNTHFEGAKMWTEEARKNPKIMIDGITYGLISIINKLGDAITVSSVDAQISEFDEIKTTEGGGSFSVLEHGQGSEKVNAFLG